MILFDGFGRGNGLLLESAGRGNVGGDLSFVGGCFPLGFSLGGRVL